MGSERPALPAPAATLACALLLLILSSAPARGQTAERLLPPPASLSHEIVRDSTHVYLLPLTQRERVRIDAVGPVMWVRLFHPDGTWLREGMALEGGTPIELELLAEEAGSYRLLVTSYDTIPLASYRLSVARVAPDSARSANETLDSATTWLTRAAHPLSTLDPSAPYDDLAGAESIFSGARVIALGEAIHGAGEFHRAGHRLARFLIERHGFSVFALETSEVAAAALNEYVLHGAGDPAAALTAQGFWIWDTADLADLVEWLREHNRRLPPERRVRFAGYDFQYHPGSREQITRFLSAVAPERAAPADSILEPLTTARDSARPDFVRYYALPSEQKTPIVAGVTDLLAFLENHRSELAAMTSEQAADSVIRRVRLLAQFADAHSRPGFAQDDPESGVATRDRYLAENVLHMLAGLPPDARVLLYAHNEHARRDPYRMGYYLGETLGSGYYALGTSFDRGEFQALRIDGSRTTPLQRFEIGPAFQGSVGWYMKRAGGGDRIVDFRGAPRGGLVAAWLSRPLPMRSIGFGYSPGNPSGYYRDPVFLGRSFDGILFIEQVTPARSNPAVRR